MKKYTCPRCGRTIVRVRSKDKLAFCNLCGILTEEESKKLLENGKK